MTSPFPDIIFAAFFTFGFYVLFCCAIGAVKSLQALVQIKKEMEENERELQKLLRKIEDEDEDESKK